MNDPFSVDGFPDVNMLITKNISSIVNPHVTNITKYVNKLTVDILLKYLDSLEMILTADLIFPGEKSTNGNTIKYMAMRIYASGKILAIYL